VAASNDFLYEPGDGPSDRLLRVGDRERDAVAEILRQRHLEGRLDTDEFQTRLERCLAAKTYADLDVLIADFPRAESERHRAREDWRWRPWTLAFPCLPLVLIAAIVIGGHAAWVAVPLVFFFVVRPLAWRAWGGRGYPPGYWVRGPRRSSRV
jgi:hypothetical protein